MRIAIAIRRNARRKDDCAPVGAMLKRGACYGLNQRYRSVSG